MSVASKPSKWPKNVLGAGSSQETAEPRVPLRLNVTRGRLGLEIYEPFDVGPLRIEQLAQSFLSLKFPLDLSGGVPAFRHRRGNLERVTITTDLDRLRQWAEPRVRSLLGPLLRPIDLWWNEAGLGVGIVRESSVMTWDLHWVPVMGQARLLVSNARGWGLTVPVLVEVLRLMDSLSGKIFQRRGRTLVLDDAGRAIGRTLLPAVGARAPAAADVAFGPLHIEDRRCRIELDSSFSQAELSPAAMRATELANIARAGDDALWQGDLEGARNHFLLALESAPRQRELVLQVAEIDIGFGRVESALGLIGESMPVLNSTMIGAMALIARGEPTAANEVLSIAANEEWYSPLASMLHLARANCETHDIDRRMILDAAVAAAPSLAPVRWARFEARAQLGDVAGAVADAQHLEAAACGRGPRHAVCRRAADAMLAAGLERPASALFQRALRYVPEDVDSMVGLARSLKAMGEGLRAIPLLERAIRLASEQGKDQGAALVELACLLASKLSDLPQAVARLRAVPVHDKAAVTARGLEGRFRLMLGDIVGASVAFSRMRELIELSPLVSNGCEMLIEAARFERDVLRDHAAAERHLALALRIAPNNAAVRELYREVAAVLAVRRQRNCSSEVADGGAAAGETSLSRTPGDREPSPG